MYAQLGTIIFDKVLSPSAMSDTKAGTYAEHAKLDGKPRLQRTGDELNVYNLEINLHRAFCVPEIEIEKIDNAIDNGDVLPLVMGNGMLMGDYVITMRTRTITQGAEDGSILTATVALVLKEYVPPLVVGSTNKTGYASAENNPRVVPDSLRNQSPSGNILAGIQQANAESSKVTDTLSQANGDAAKKVTLMQKIRKTIKTMNEALEKAQRLLDQIASTLDSADRIRFAIDRTITAGNNVSGYLAQGNLDGAISANDELISAVTGLNTASYELTELQATKLG